LLLQAEENAGEIIYLERFMYLYKYKVNPLTYSIDEAETCDPIVIFDYSVVCCM